MVGVISLKFSFKSIFYIKNIIQLVDTTIQKPNEKMCQSDQVDFDANYNAT